MAILIKTQARMPSVGHLKQKAALAFPTGLAFGVAFSGCCVLVPVLTQQSSLHSLLLSLPLALVKLVLMRIFVVVVLIHSQLTPPPTSATTRRPLIWVLVVSTVLAEKSARKAGNLFGSSPGPSLHLRQHLEH